LKVTALLKYNFTVYFCQGL